MQQAWSGSDMAVCTFASAWFARRAHRHCKVKSFWSARSFWLGVLFLWPICWSENKSGEVEITITQVLWSLMALNKEATYVHVQALIVAHIPVLHDTACPFTLSVREGTKFSNPSPVVLTVPMVTHVLCFLCPTSQGWYQETGWRSLGTPV